MANSNKNKKIFGSLAEKLDEISSGESTQDVEILLNRAFNNFVGGFKPNNDDMPYSDFANRVIRNLQRYAELTERRKSVNIEGGERIIAGEDEALEALHLSYGLLEDVVLPFFIKKDAFSNKLFNEVHNLSLSYVDAIVDATADEYIDLEDVLDAKLDATELAKKGSRICESYRSKGLDQNTRNLLAGFKSKLINTRGDLMRAYQTVATTRKKVYNRVPLTEKIIQELLSENEQGLEFEPDFILPIAHGGTELGIDVANAYEDVGIDAPVYPLMYSIKTRKQKYPWVHYDGEFFEGGLEEKELLVTEDWVTTGNTLRGILNELEAHFPREVRVATIKRDREKSFVPILDKYKIYAGALALYTGTKTDALSDMKK